MIVICEFMLNKLKLRGDELLVYAIIYGFTHGIQDWMVEFDYISDCLGLTGTAIKSILESLCNKGFIKYDKFGRVEVVVDID